MKFFLILAAGLALLVVVGRTTSGHETRAEQLDRAYTAANR